MKIPKTKLAHIAKMIESNGNISVVKGNVNKINFYYGGYVYIGNMGERSISYLTSNFGGRICWEFEKNSKKKYGWVLEDCKDFLGLIYPFLFSNKEQARLVMEFKETVQSYKGKRGKYKKSSKGLIKKRERLLSKCKKLNKQSI